MVLFGVGGLIGFTIQGSNVKIPAHYHGCIVGVTLALMGARLPLLPRLGFGAPDAKLATLQPYLYGVGQLMHIVGLRVVGRLRRAAQGGRRRAGAAQRGARSPAWG